MTDASESNPPTEFLLRSLHGGERGALEGLLQRHLGWIEQRVRQRLGQDLRRFGETGDFVQEAMVNVLEYGPQFVVQDGEHFRRLLARIIENCLRGKHRYLHQQRRGVRREKPLGSGTILSLDPPRQQTTRPSAAAAKAEQLAWVRLAVELMPELDRDVLTLREVDGLGFKEIGVRVDASEDAVRMRYKRALPRLAQRVRALKQGSISELLDEESC